MPEPSDELRDLVGRVELEDLSFVELAARRADGAASGSDEVTPQYTLNAEHGEDGRHFRLTLSIEIDTAVGSVKAAAAASYLVECAPDDPPSRRVVVEYANEVGVMALLPYLRHAIADLTLRVFGSALLMPVMPRGAVVFPLPD
ncbi:MAG TPA: hypothetical protein VNR62_02560 [Cellulomonas sp.]|nr:hypothetical protein [Cellulomonas sp.]